MNYYNKKQIAKLLNLAPKTLSRWLDEIGLNFGRGVVGEDSFIEIKEAIRQYLLNRINKKPPT